MVVLPEDSGPKISTTRPRGTPPTPNAASNEIAPVEITAIGTMASFDPSRMMEPLPNCFSICAKCDIDCLGTLAKTLSVAFNVAFIVALFGLLRSSAMMAAPVYESGISGTNAS
jgi:hypothetical protein